MSAFFINVWHVMLELAPWLLFGAAIAAVLHVLIPPAFIKKHLGGKSWWHVAKASFIGVPMPLCSCSVIPTGIGLKKDGASDGASISFLISTPQTGVDSIMVAAGFLGWPFAIFKVLSAFIMGMVGGQLVNLLIKEHDASAADAATAKSCCSPPAAPVKSCCDEGPDSKTLKEQAAERTSCCDEPAPAAPVSCCDEPAQTATPQASRLWRGLDFAINDLLHMIWLWLIIGVLISAALSSFIAPDALSDYYWSSGIVAMLVMLLISLPLYVCATASVPIAASLIAAGMPMGAALVFLMAGPATNVATIGAIAKAFGKGTTLIYLLTVIIGSIALGMLFEISFDFKSDVTAIHEHGHATWWAVSSAIILCLLFIYFAYIDIGARLRKSKANNTANKQEQTASCH